MCGLSDSSIALSHGPKVIEAQEGTNWSDRLCAGARCVRVIRRRFVVFAVAVVAATGSVFVGHATWGTSEGSKRPSTTNGKLPGLTRGSYHDQSTAPFDYLTADQGLMMGKSIPWGADVYKARNEIVFNTTSIYFAVLATPFRAPTGFFLIAGLVDPTLVVPKGATITLTLINTDRTRARGWLLRAAFPHLLPSANPKPAFPGAFAFPLRPSSALRLQAEIINFRAVGSGAFQYLSPANGPAPIGIGGAFRVVGHTQDQDLTNERYAASC